MYFLLLIIFNFVKNIWYEYFNLVEVIWYRIVYRLNVNENWMILNNCFFLILEKMKFNFFWDLIKYFGIKIWIYFILVWI